MEGSNSSHWAVASGQGINLTIQNLANEQERVQKKTFTNWMNTYLSQRSPPMKVENLFEEVKDGIVLLSLLEVLSGERLPTEKGYKLSRPHHLANISTALSFLERKKIKLVNINPSSIADGKPAIVLGLVWTIILYFQIEESFTAVPNREDASQARSVLPKQNLLGWVDGLLSKNYGLHIKDFTKSWTDGVAFNAMIHNIRPDLVDMERIKRQQARVNLEQAFSTAENQLGIPRLLDAEDVDVEKPDEKSIMTYVAQFIKKFPGGASGVPGTNIDTADNEIKAYSNVLSWLNGEAREVLSTSLQPVVNRESEFLDYLGFTAELERREPLYLALGEKVKSGRAVKVTQAEWKVLAERWEEVKEQTQQWLKKLDSTLPGRLGQLGVWLYQADKLLRKKEAVTSSTEEMVALYTGLTREHQEFFQDLDGWRQFWAQIKGMGRYEGFNLHGPHVEHLSKRLEVVTREATARENKLNYNLSRHKLQSLLRIYETKVASWTAKCGELKSVDETLTDYMHQVDKLHMIDSFERLWTNTRQVADKFKLQGADSKEAANIDILLQEVSTKWKTLSKEITNVRSSLEEIRKTWSTFNSSVDVLNKWLTKGKQVLLQQNSQETEEFFKDLGAHEKDISVLNDSGKFLIGVANERTSEQVNQTMLSLNQRFQQLADDFHHFHQTEVLGKARSQYEHGIFNLESFLNEASTALERRVQCVHSDLKEYLLELDRCNTHIIEAENNFKTTTKTAQSLVKDSSKEDINSMLKTLNDQKEVIVKLRKEIPEQIKYVKAVLPNVESLETGIHDLERWLEEGDKLLNSHQVDGSPEQTDHHLQTHKAFFTETTYQKSILESKNKVYQKIHSARPKLRNVDFKPVETLMSSANHKFQNVVTNAKDWERNLESLARLWRTLQQKQQKLEEWLDAAQDLLDVSQDNPDSLIQKHKMFFGRTDHRLLSDYETIAADILLKLGPAEGRLLSQTVSHLKDRWEHMLHHAPIKLLKLEFAVPENKFEQSLEVAEQELQQEKDQLRHNQNVKEALSRHKLMFQSGSLIPSCEQSLEQMKDLAHQLLKLSQDEQSLDHRFQNHWSRWQKVKKIAADILTQLKQTPERWKEYHDKLAGFVGLVQNLERLKETLNQDGLTSDEYKDALAKFEKEMRNMSRYQGELQQLEQNLGHIMEDAPEADLLQERQNFDNLQQRFQRLKADMSGVLSKSGQLSKGYEYRENVETLSRWLDQVQALTMEHPAIDSLEDARTYLHETEALISQLESEKPNIQAEIQAGQNLLRNKGAPVFVSKCATELGSKWTGINDKIAAKYEKLKKQVKDWENYDNKRGGLLNYLKRTEKELEKPLETLSQEGAVHDFQSKKDLQSSLQKLKGSLTEVHNLNQQLVAGASKERQGPLGGEVADMEHKVEHISQRLNTKMTDLESAMAKWSDYYKRLNNFCDWLNEKEAKLNEVYENKQDSPETQLQKAEGISSQVFENHITLENLEKDARGLTQNFRSRETSALKSKLTSIRRQWDSLCNLARDRSSTLAGSVAHWQKYQTLHDQLLPWVLKAEKYCATELPKCVSLEEAGDLYELHQAFLQECEENLPTFDQLSSEAGYLTDQPNLQRELETFQKRWGHILTSSEDRSHKVDKVHAAWLTYGTELETVEEILAKVSSHLARKPDLHTCDVQVLEHELALAKALQDEMRGHQNEFTTFTRHYQQVHGLASPEGQRLLQEQHDSISSRWKHLNSDILERQKALTDALVVCKDFSSRLQGVEKWAKAMMKKLNSGKEVYSDELADTLRKLATQDQECQSQEPIFQALQHSFTSLSAGLNTSEAGQLRELFHGVVQVVEQVKNLVTWRQELCRKWAAYTESQTEIRNKLRTLQARLASPQVKQGEVAQIMQEVEGLRRSMQPWTQEAAMLDELMVRAQMVIKDRASQRSLLFPAELKTLIGLCEGMQATARQRESQLEELGQLQADFSHRQEDLQHHLHQVQERVKLTQAGTSSLEGLQSLVEQIENLASDLHSQNQAYQQLRELGRRISATDPARTAAIQQDLVQINSDWEAAENMLAEKQQLYGSLVNSWQGYLEDVQEVNKAMVDLQPLLKQELALIQLDDVKKCLDQHKNAEFSLKANQAHLEQVNEKGGQLVANLKKVPGLKTAQLEQELQDLNQQSKTTGLAIKGHRENLEAQLECWDQIQTQTEEVGSWVNSMIKKLEDSLQNFDGAERVESRLVKFKNEAPKYKEMMAAIDDKLQDLQALNGNKVVPSLTADLKQNQKQLDKAASLVKELEATLSQYFHKEQSLEKAVSDAGEWMNKLKETVSLCDNITGNFDELISRSETCQELKQRLAGHRPEMLAIQQEAAFLQQHHPSTHTASLVREGASTTQKFEALKQRVDRIQESLQSQLDQQLADGQQQQSRWLTSASDKVAWCGDIAGDCYSLSSKLATLKEIEDSLVEGGQRQRDLTSKLHASKNILPVRKFGELETAQQKLEKRQQDLVAALQQTQKKLESLTKQWHEHNQQFEVLSQWLQSTEASVRDEATLRSDLPGKKDQLKTLQALVQSIMAHGPEMAKIKEGAEQMSKMSGDGRVVSYTGQLADQYRTLLALSKGQAETYESYVKEHELYEMKYKTAEDWLNLAGQELERGSSLSGGQDMLSSKLGVVKDLQASQEKGSSLLNAALEVGEKLYPNTSNEGRESLRREMRSLRDMWDRFHDSLSNTQRQLESSQMEMLSFDENYEQLLKWIAETEAQLGESDFKSTLPEKRALLQQHKAGLQDICSHQKVIDSLSKKGAALSSFQVENKLKQLNARYSQLCQAAENYVKRLQEYVNEHQSYQDTHQECQAWIAAARNKVGLCTEVTGDKQTLVNRLDRLQELRGSMKEGESLVRQSHQQGQTTLAHSSAQGQASINQQLAGLGSDWESLRTAADQAQHRLLAAIQAVEDYDHSCEAMALWLQETESKLNHAELKTTFEEKELHVEFLKSLQQEIHSKRVQLQKLQSLEAQVQSSDARLANPSIFLANQYEAVSKLAHDVTEKWEELVEEHKAFIDSCRHCLEWVGTLRTQLTNCAGSARDKHQLNTHMLLLQELITEKDEGSNHIHQTIESGERLFPNTSAAGRDIIRLDIRNLRDQWKGLQDEMSETQQKLELLVNQWSSFDDRLDSFKEWLQDVEARLQGDQHLLATLPEKRAHLQNHKVTHEDLLTREHVIDNLRKQAHLFSKSSPSPKITQSVDELQLKFDSLCGRSKEILERLERSVLDHQQYQDAVQDFSDWLKTAREKVEACSDRSGDKLFLSTRIKRMKEYTAQAKVGESKLSLAKKLGASTAENTSTQGRELLQRELAHLHREWQDYLKLMKHTEASLNQTLEMWNHYESQLEYISHWLVDMELKVKGHDLKNTLKEKLEELEKIKKHKDEAVSHQPEVDQFLDEAQLLMHTSSDPRLSSHLSQVTNKYQGLVTSFKDLFSRWEKSVQEHQLYENCLADFNKFTAVAEQRLKENTHPIAGNQSLEEKKAIIQVLHHEKDLGDQKLSLLLAAGERLFPETAAVGRERVSGELHKAKWAWENFLSELGSAEHSLDVFSQAWLSFTQIRDQLLQWLADAEAALKSKDDLQNTLQEKRFHLQNYRTFVQEVASQQRVLTALKERAHEVLQGVDNPEITECVKQISKRFENLQSSAVNQLKTLEEHVRQHHDHQNKLQAVLDWLTGVKDKQNLCASAEGDKQSLQAKLARLQEITASTPEGARKLEDYDNSAQLTMDSTGLKGRQVIQSQLKTVHADWEDYVSRCRSLKESLEKALHLWERFEVRRQHLSSWVKSAEKQVKERPLMNTLETKQEQLAKYTALAQEIREQQPELDAWTAEAQSLHQLSSDSQIVSTVSGLTASYQSLRQAAKDTVSQVEKHIQDHQLYRVKHADCCQWLDAASHLLDRGQNLGSKQDIQEKLDKIQGLVRDKSTGQTKLNQCVEAGERLYSATAHEGREAVRQELQQLKLKYDSLIEHLSDTQNQLEACVSQWTSFDQSYGQVEYWLADMKAQFEPPLPLKSSLEEKKHQLTHYKRLQQDILSYHKVLDNIREKAEPLSQSNRTSELAQFISLMGSTYQQLCVSAQEHVTMYEQYVREHQTFSDSYQSCLDWLNSLQRKLAGCSDLSGDRNIIQNHLYTIQEIWLAKGDGDKVTEVLRLAEQALAHTSTEGRLAVTRDQETLRSKWAEFSTTLAKTKESLDLRLTKLTELENKHDSFALWFKTLESQLKDSDLKATLVDKQSHHQKLRALHSDIVSHKPELDLLRDAAKDQDLVNLNAAITSNISQLTVKMKGAEKTSQELCQTWDQFITEHQMFNQAFDHCQSWLRQLDDKLGELERSTSEDAPGEDILSKLQLLLPDREESIHLLQVVLERLQTVLPNTSTSGRERLHMEVQSLQKEYDQLSSRLTDVKARLEESCSQSQGFQESLQQLHRWLQDLDSQLLSEAALQNTLQEKLLQLDRVKVIDLNVASQQSSVSNLQDRAQHMRATPHNGSLLGQLVGKHQDLLQKVKELKNQTEKNVHDHQAYRSAYMKTSDWLMSANEKLGLYSSPRGDRLAVEAVRHKVQEIGLAVEEGKNNLMKTQEKGNLVMTETSTYGQNLIREELELLTSDFNSFLADLNEVSKALDSLSEEWTKYEELYEEISHNIKDTESEIKASAGLGASLDQKTALLHNHESVKVRIKQDQARLTQLKQQAQQLRQQSTDDRVTAQLQPLTDKFSSLVKLSDEYEQKCRQNVQEHEHYLESLKKAQALLQKGRKKLSMWATSSGQKDDLESKLEQLKEFMDNKEIKTSIQSAESSGEVTINNTSVKGREVIRQELHQLMEDWETFCAEATNTRMMLESGLLEWSDYTASHDQILKWLKSTEKRLRDNQVQPDLAGKKTELQSAKELYRDVASYEPMVESLAHKAVDLAERSPASRTRAEASQILTRYSQVKEQAKELLSASEKNVALHQDYMDACHKFSAWFQAAVEKQKSCCESCGERQVVEANMEKTQSLLNNLNEGTQRLADATETGEALLQFTSPPGQTKIKHELQAMHKKFEEFRVQLLKNLSELEHSQELWNQFEESYQLLNSWLREAHNFLRAEIKPKATLEEKRQQWQEMKMYGEEVLGRASSLDVVSDRARALLATSGDASVTHAVSQIQARYEEVVTLMKEVTTQLEGYYNSHRVYQDNLLHLNQWLQATKQALVAISAEKISKETVNNNIIQSENIQKSLEQGHRALHAVLESFVQILPSTNQQGAGVLRKETSAAKTAYENILTQISELKRSLAGILTQWENFEHMYEQEVAWLADKEAQMSQAPGYKADLPEKKLSLEKCKTMEADIVSHTNQLMKLEEKANKLGDEAVKSKLADLGSKFNSLLQKSQENVQNAEQQVVCHEEFRKLYMENLDQLTNNKNLLKQVADYSGDQRTLEARLSHLQNLKRGMDQGQETLALLASQSLKLCGTTSAQGQELVQKEMTGLQDGWGQLSSSVAQVEQKLEEGISSLGELADKQRELGDWLQQVEGKLRACQHSQADLSSKSSQLRGGQSLLDEIMAHKADFAKVRDKGEELAKQSNDMRMLDNILQMSNRFQDLNSLAKSTVSKLKESVESHSQYDEALSDAANWLQGTMQTVTGSCQQSGSSQAVQASITKIKALTEHLDEGLSKVNHVCDQAEKILPLTSHEGKKLIEQQVTELTTEWDQLNKDIADCTSVLEGEQLKWHQYEQSSAGLMRWLAETESSLSSNPSPCDHFPDRQTQLVNYQMVVANIDENSKFVSELADRIASLRNCDDPKVGEHFHEVQARYSTLTERAGEIVGALRVGYSEHEAFFLAHQSCQQWLQEMSQKLVAHNRLNTSTLELTNQQIEKHETLQNEIDQERVSLDSLKELAQEVVASNPGQDSLARQVQADLIDLEQSYQNVQSMSHQIGDRLSKIVKKWQDYQQKLNQTEDYLTNDFPDWLSQASSYLPKDQRDAQKQREMTQEALQKLYAIKQELLNSVPPSENFGSTDRLDVQSESGLSQFSDEVKSKLSECLNQAEKHLDSLRENISKWDSVNSLRQDLQVWLHNKQDELYSIQNLTSNKFHPEDSELYAERLKTLRVEVRSKAAAMEELQAQYRSLTQHSPSSQDPVIRALQDDLEELLGQTDNLIQSHEETLSRAADDSMDRYLEELDGMQLDTVNTSTSLPVQRRRCRSTQTPSNGTKSDSDDDDSPWKSPRDPRGKNGFSRRSSMAKRPFDSPQSPRGSPHTLSRSLNTSKRSYRPGVHHNDSLDAKSLKKGFGANATLESESDESGYGETYGDTTNALSLDLQHDSFSSEVTHTPLTYDDSDNESTESFIIGEFPAVHPDDLRHVSTQTPGNVRTQTVHPSDFMCETMTQTERLSASASRLFGSATSLHSVGAQTKRSSGSRIGLLKNILVEVKDIKRQQGLNDSREETMSEASVSTIGKNTLDTIYRDLQSVRAARAHQNATTQTVSEQSTQTSFFEGSMNGQAQHDAVNNIGQEMRQLRNDSLLTAPNIPNGAFSDFQRSQSPSQNRNIPDFERTQSHLLNRAGVGFHRNLSPSLHAGISTQSPFLNTAGTAQPGQTYLDSHLGSVPGATHLMHTMAGAGPSVSLPNNGRARVTPLALNNISQRLDRLSNYQIPRRLSPYISPYQTAPGTVLQSPPQISAPPPARTGRRYHVREFTRSYDDMDLMSDHRNRRRQSDQARGSVMDRYHLDDALIEASRMARQLKRMSANMKRNLRQELNRHWY